MKRGRNSESLTGGTGDVNPQWYTCAANAMDAPNTFSEVATPVPIARQHRSTSSKATVFEVLKVIFITGNIDQTFDATFSRKNVQVQVSTRSLQTLGIFPLNPAVIAFYTRTYAGLVADDPADQQFALVTEQPFVVDLTDGAGHGVLVASDNLYVGLNTEGYLAATSCVVKILYRFKDVTLTEYIGMVQSQA